MTVSLALDGAGLGAAWGEQTARSMLSDAGFTDVATERVEGDVLNVYYVARKGDDRQAARATVPSKAPMTVHPSGRRTHCPPGRAGP
jgi:Zn-dependent membrane protease YugP